MKYHAFLILICVASLSAASQELILRQVWARQATGTVVDTNLYFYSKGHTATWTAPFMTASQTNMTWINPLGFATNTVAPGINFFTNAGMYMITCPDWSKVTRLSFQPGVAGRSYLTNMVNTEYVSTRLTGLTSAQAMFAYLTNYPTSATDWSFANSSNIATFSECYRGTRGDRLPEISASRGVATSIEYLYRDNTTIKQSADYSTFTNVTSLQYVNWGCTAMTNASAISNLTKVGPISYAWAGCSSLIDFPELGNCTNITGCLTAWSINSATLGPKHAPSLANCKKIASIQASWYGNGAITDSVDSIFGDYSGLTNLTVSIDAFINCIRLSGVGSNFVNAVKHPNYSVGTATTNSSYRTFAGCTNLLDYATIPAAYK